MNILELLENITKYDDDRCLCEGCQVVYVKDLIAGKDTDPCECCYKK